jgi:hypothetical protein
MRIWSKIRPELKRASRQIDQGPGPMLPISTPALFSPGSVAPLCHGQKELCIEETIHR